MELNLLKKLFHQYSGTIQDTNNTCEPSLQINGKYFLRLKLLFFCLFTLTQFR